MESFTGQWSKLISPPLAESSKISIKRSKMKDSTLCISVIKGFVYAMLAIAIVLAFFQPEILAMVLVIASMLAAAGA
jgi:hypothetical protein